MTDATTTAGEPTVQQLFDLTGRVALITGARGYLGRAMASALAEAGAQVVVSSRDPQSAQDVAVQLGGPESGTHFGIGMDHLQPESIEQGFEQVIRQTGRVDILINNGNYPCGADWSTVTAEQFQQQLANVTGYFLLARHVRNHAVQQQQPASIVMLGSMYGVVGSYPDAYEGVCAASPAAYHTLKGGIVHLTRHLAVYWARDQVRVNCLSPGPFPGPQAPPEMVTRLKQKSPQGRMGLPHELKGAVVFLASDAASYVTGQNLIVDGGWTSW